MKNLFLFAVRRFACGGGAFLCEAARFGKRNGAGTGIAAAIFPEGVGLITFEAPKTLFRRHSPGEEKLPAKTKPVFKREESIL